MSRKSIAAVVALIGIAACGGNSSTAKGPTVAMVAAQPTDLPKGLIKCDQSGDIEQYISTEQSIDPKIAKGTQADWDEAKKNGATAAYVSVYSDAASQCEAVKKGTNVTATTHPLLFNFVIQFKDEKSAAKVYVSPKKVFGYSPADLKQTTTASPSPLLEGEKTGLGANSIVLSASAQSQWFYIAMWQKKAFVVDLATVNMDPTASKKVATSENARIK